MRPLPNGLLRATQIGFLFWSLSGCDNAPPPHITHPGQIIYLGYKDTYASCARCHGEEGQGGMEGPEIRNAMREFGREKVREFILYGKGLGKDAMPGFREEFTDEEVEQILDFLETWVAADSLTDSLSTNDQQKGEKSMLKEGDPAPDFELPDENGNPVKLSDFRGKKVVLYFYPKDHTSGCTREAQAFRDAFDAFQAENTVILGVSKDSQKSHQNFKNKHNLPFPLLSDPETKVLQQYGVLQEKSMYGRKYMGTVRTTFLIDENGIIRRIWPKVKVDGHEQEVLEAVRGS